MRAVNVRLVSLILIAATTLVGCARFRRGRGVTASWEDEEIIPGDMQLIGERFEETRTLVDGVRFENVLFGFDSFRVPPGEVHKIERVASHMMANPAVVLVVEGHCDERGSREYNLSLGEQRAQAVRAYLISLGVGADRIQTVSYGKERPIDHGHNEAAWRLNRRSEFVLYR